ncbi:SseB family protein [Actinopolyspora mortivallis]|uniref:SseB family protein n=1 Tax=Actinopolyspora mortivallis TaxID=33906 RepID=UPI0003648249|nr:SseB family protein [Actinopolyspora mortivallis]
MRGAGWSGTLPIPSGQKTPTPAEELARAALELRQGRGHQGLVEVLRGSEVFVETEHDEHGSPVVTTMADGPDGVRCLPVFSSQRWLAEYLLRRGHTGPAHYGTLSGAELLDEMLPQLPPGTCVLLDPTAEHTVVLPPLPGVVPAEIAVSLERAEGDDDG